MAWFQVDDQLAMHRKVCEAGNSAMGLWVRAGSWAMANLTEGFVPRSAARTLGSKAQADALVKSGLWVVVDGGYQFHEWGTRQMSAEQIADRRLKRAEAGRKGGQASGVSKREANTEANASPDGPTSAAFSEKILKSPGGKRDSIREAKSDTETPAVQLLPAGMRKPGEASALASGQAKLKRNGTPVPVPVLSVVTKGGNGTEVDARNFANTPPPPRCPKHINRDDDPPCRDCRAARVRREAWDADRTQAESRRRSAFWAEVEHCPDCGPKGQVDKGNGTGRCPQHDWSLINA